MFSKEVRCSAAGPSRELREAVSCWGGTLSALYRSVEHLKPASRKHEDRIASFCSVRMRRQIQPKPRLRKVDTCPYEVRPVSKCTNPTGIRSLWSNDGSSETDERVRRLRSLSKERSTSTRCNLGNAHTTGLENHGEAVRGEYTDGTRVGDRRKSFCCSRSNCCREHVGSGIAS